MTHFSIERDHLCLESGVTVTFHRTLRIPDDGKSYPLPPGLGTFPLRRVEDYLDRVPESFRERGGIFLPMYQREALWLGFSARRPHALKIAVGKVCALTGRRWSEDLGSEPQDYVVAPHQPWLDGIMTESGKVRQFVAMPLGLGYTVEGQITGEETFGGIQLKAFPARPGAIPEIVRGGYDGAVCAPMCAALGAARPRSSAGPMGLGAGGRIQQKVYPDPHGIETWDTTRAARCFVHVVNSELWREITGEKPPETPITARDYSRHGLPWFSLYDERAHTLDAQSTLAQVKSVRDIDGSRSVRALQDDDSVSVGPIRKLLHLGASTVRRVRDGDW